MTFLLDTNIVSELKRQDPDSRLLAWFGTVEPSDLHLSVLTIGEIRRGVERLRRRDPLQAARMERWLAGLQMSFRDRIVEVDASIAQEWGRINVPDPLPVVDGLLAASAIVRGWTLVTRNVRDVQRCGVRLLDPFEPRTA
ncbi:MAG TPA: type II toxin-antitoxin system VapC family toxin [Streptosporangiaceae bacterium]|nr:type II toxin-antitoxin system VapC family toxin [Streptosporangiaceae bacterium]